MENILAGVNISFLHNRDFSDSFIVLVEINKMRTEYKRPGLLISVDEIDGLGRFIEFESENLLGTREMQQLVESGKIINLPIGYVEMMVKKKNPSLYLKGKYSE